MTLPLSVAQVLASPSWQGGPLVQLEDTISKPKAEDLVLNYCWICPIVKKFRSQIPSQFYLIDVFLYMDKIYNGRLLIPQEAGDSKETLATDEAKKMKLCIGSLRSLWRSTSSLFYLSKGLLMFCFVLFVRMLFPHLWPICFSMFQSFLRNNALRHQWQPPSHHRDEGFLAAIAHEGKGIYGGWDQVDSRQLGLQSLFKVSGPNWITKVHRLKFQGFWDQVESQRFIIVPRFLGPS